MSGTLTIRRQIRSIRNTKKITKAMELVSASKMRRAVASALATRPYAQAAWDLLSNFSSPSVYRAHPLLAVRQLKRSAILIIGSNRGLCGSFNNQIIDKSVSAIKSALEQGASEVRCITFGRRVRTAIGRTGHKIYADFSKNDITTSILDISGIAHLLIEEYSKGIIDSVSLCSSTFVSSVKQIIEVKQLLPLQYRTASKEKGITGSAGMVGEAKQEFEPVYLFEPSSQKVFEHIIPRILETQLFQAVLESEASEQSARMLAMHNATEAASDILQGLHLAYNQIRQTSITQEVAELSAGRAALEA